MFLFLNSSFCPDLIIIADINIILLIYILHQTISIILIWIILNKESSCTHSQVVFSRDILDLVTKKRKRERTQNYVVLRICRWGRWVHSQGFVERDWYRAQGTRRATRSLLCQERAEWASWDFRFVRPMSQSFNRIHFDFDDEIWFAKF